jgi:hypothetical protein
MGDREGGEVNARQYAFTAAVLAVFAGLTVYLVGLAGLAYMLFWVAFVAGLTFLAVRTLIRLGKEAGND